jgi:hypothetical protein
VQLSWSKLATSGSGIFRRQNGGWGMVYVRFISVPRQQLINIRQSLEIAFDMGSWQSEVWMRGGESAAQFQEGPLIIVLRRERKERSPFPKLKGISLINCKDPMMSTMAVPERKAH